MEGYLERPHADIPPIDLSLMNMPLFGDPGVHEGVAPLSKALPEDVVGSADDLPEEVLLVGVGNQFLDDDAVDHAPAELWAVTGGRLCRLPGQLWTPDYLIATRRASFQQR